MKPTLPPDWLGDMVRQTLERRGLALDTLNDSQRQVVEDALEEAAQTLTANLWTMRKRALANARRLAVVHRQELRSLWRPALDGLCLLIEYAHEAGAQCFAEEMTSANPPPALADALLRLAARGCQVAREIHCLLEAGYPDGAHARWRTLYELSIVASFIHQHGADTAERYLAYDTVEALMAARKYQKGASTVGAQLIPDAVMTDMVASVQALQSKYGQAFCERGGYGWASEALEHGNVKFAQLEEALGLSAVRSFYSLASFNVHATPRGIMTRLGEDQPGTLLAGPTVLAIDEVATAAAQSLWRLTAVILDVTPTVTRRTLMRVSELLTDKALGVIDDCRQVAARRLRGE